MEATDGAMPDGGAEDCESIRSGSEVRAVAQQSRRTASVNREARVA